MNMCSEPVKQRLKLSGRNLFIEAFNFAFRFFQNTGGIEVTEGISGEITESAVGPVDILKASLSVIGNCDSEEICHFFTPHRRNILCFQIAVEECLFYLKADDHMQVVTAFVCINPDQ
mgnify:CR=1 FL=1